VGGIAAAAALGGSVSYSALNWGGYAALPAQNQSFTSVTSTFTVPQLDCTGTAGQRVGGTLLELWSALDGAYQPGVPVSIEQVGVEPGCHNGVQSNPTSYMVTFAKKTGKSVTVFGQITLNGGIDVPTGDSITATASHSGTTVILTLRDNGTGASGSFSTTCPKASCAYRSAEAILEAPGATAAFGTVSFTGSSVTDSAGHTGGLLTSGPWWNTEDLTLVGQAVPGGRLVPCETTGPYDTGSGGFVLTSSGGCISS
jgi:hypothetical protein